MDRIILWGVLVCTAAQYIVQHHFYRYGPTGSGPNGWWLWHDQDMYLRAAQAWAAGQFDPALHWYFPGYPMLAAVFDAATPSQPFYLPDLLCLLAFGWLFVALARLLAPQMRHAVTVAALTFLVTVDLSPPMIQSFVIPWNSTPTAPLTYAALLLAIHFITRPTAWRAASLACASLSVALFRPVDAVILTAVVAPFAGAALLRDRLPWRRKVAIVAAAAAGGAVPSLLLVGIYLLIYGWARSGYLQLSENIGFEWRLLAFRWVTIFVSPRPLFPAASGMTQMFPWVVPGVAGLVAVLIAAGRATWFRHALIVVATVVHCAVYLTYRDLHPQGLMDYGNFHYFKWTVPIIGLYAVYLVALVGATRRRRQAWIAAACATVALFCWRPKWREAPPGESLAAKIVMPRTLLLPDDPIAPLRGVRLATKASFSAIFLAQGLSLRVGGKTYVGNDDLKSFPVQDGFFLTALRPIAPGPAVVTFDPRLTLDDSVPPRFGSETLVFGMPDLAPRSVKAWWRACETWLEHHT